MEVCFETKKEEQKIQSGVQAGSGSDERGRRASSSRSCPAAGGSSKQLIQMAGIVWPKREEAFPGKGKLSSSDEELRRLQRENMRLREEREILKKALVFFSNESK